MEFAEVTRTSPMLLILISIVCVYLLYRFNMIIISVNDSTARVSEEKEAHRDKSRAGSGSEEEEVKTGSRAGSGSEEAEEEIITVNWVSTNATSTNPTNPTNAATNPTNPEAGAVAGTEEAMRGGGEMFSFDFSDITIDEVRAYKDPWFLKLAFDPIKLINFLRKSWFFR